MTTPEDVLSFWLGDPPVFQTKWFVRSDAVDDEIRARFGATIDAASRGELDAWKATPRGLLALIIVLDQFSRNVFRGTAQAFANDARALALTVAALDAEFDRTLAPIERYCLYMPLMHAEDRHHQETGVRLFEAMAASDAASGPLASAAKYARAHRDIVAKFGRFPHRNALLGRTSTTEEVEFLKQPGSSF